jgi:hypothetical protein
MRRVLVIGICGAGKSTFSRTLARKTGLPLIHLDKEYWKPGWTKTPRDLWRARVGELVAGDRWIIDGNYAGSLDLRLPRADTVVRFDYPRPPPARVVWCKPSLASATTWARDARAARPEFRALEPTRRCGRTCRRARRSGGISIPCVSGAMAR